MSAVAPYGSWKSPVSSELIVAGTRGIGSISIDGDTIYWLEMRPEEKGRYVIVRREPDGQTDDMLPAPWNVRTRVHEYGGGSYLVHQATIYFVNFSDQRLYRLDPGGAPQPLTPEKDLRFADFAMDEARARLICVREDHTTGDREAVNTIAAVRLDGSDVDSGGVVLVSGSNFFSTPCLSPDGKQLAWLSWNHPNMPWDGTELRVAKVKEDGSLEPARVIAGGKEESIFQPQWSPDGMLYFISDRTGWWNLYRWGNGEVQALHPDEAEYGLPQWVFGMSTFQFERANRLVCLFYKNGTWNLGSLDTSTLDFSVLDVPYTFLSGIKAMPGKVVLNAGSPKESIAIIQYSLDDGSVEVLRRSSDLQIDPGYLSTPQEIAFPTSGGLTAYAYYYPPANKDFAAPQGELPPLLVLSHGGPTGATNSVLDLEIQYYTSRGFAVVDVNYGGSTGYGRAYRQRLNGKWGIVDVDDCTNAALFLAKTGRADPNRLAITGGSAGGYTTLCALTFRKVFKAGASHFGVSDAEALALDTHKFESRYLDNLIGPYPEAKDVYVARSPIHFAHQMECALILFQGSEDQVVPPEQSRRMFEAVRAKELPVAYIEFEGEQHGFRQAANIKRALDGEFFFYSRIFGFSPADDIEPVEIENI